MLKSYAERILKCIGIKKLCVFFLAVVSLIVMSSLIEAEKENRMAELEALKKSSNFAGELLKNKSKLSFISRHLFKRSANSFETYLKKVLEENHIRLVKVSHKETIDLKDVKKTKIIIEGVVWHDSSVFKLIDYLNCFSPGFVRISKVGIEKTDEISTFNPTIRMEIICELFQLK